LAVPRTLEELSAAGAEAGDIFLGLLETILAIIVPNGTGIVLGVQVNAAGNPVVFNTHGSSNVFWSRAVIADHSICTITLALAFFAADQLVLFVCVHPIGSFLLGCGGNITIGNCGCRAGRIGRRHVALDSEIRKVLVANLPSRDVDAVVRNLDSPANAALRARLAVRTQNREEEDEVEEEEVEEEEEEEGEEEGEGEEE